MTAKLCVTSCSRVLLGESEQANIAEQPFVPPGVRFGVISWLLSGDWGEVKFPGGLGEDVREVGVWTASVMWKVWARLIWTVVSGNPSPADGGWWSCGQRRHFRSLSWLVCHFLLLTVCRVLCRHYNLFLDTLWKITSFSRKNARINFIHIPCAHLWSCS